MALCDLDTLQRCIRPGWVVTLKGFSAVGSDSHTFYIFIFYNKKKTEESI